MRRIQLVLVGIVGSIGSIVGLTPAVQAQDLEALKTSFTAEVQALNARDPEAAVAEVDDGVVMFSLFSPFPIRGKVAFRQAVEEYITAYEQATFMPLDTKFHIAGTTGLAWGYYALTARLQDGPSGSFHGRYVWTYTQAAGKWRLLSLHLSPLQHRQLRVH
jgi:ketosteroid isomerase-like protein